MAVGVIVAVDIENLAKMRSRLEIIDEQMASVRGAMIEATNRARSLSSELEEHDALIASTIAGIEAGELELEEGQKIAKHILEKAEGIHMRLGALEVVALTGSKAATFISETEQGSVAEAEEFRQSINT